MTDNERWTLQDWTIMDEVHLCEMLTEREIGCNSDVLKNLVSCTHL